MRLFVYLSVRVWLSVCVSVCLCVCVVVCLFVLLLGYDIVLLGLWFVCLLECVFHVLFV